MANDTDIKIGLKTVGADTAAGEIGKVPDAIEQIPASVPDAVDAIDEIPEAIDKIPEATPDAVEAVDKVTDSITRMTDEARTAQAELDVIEAKRRKAARDAQNERGIMGSDVSGAAATGVGTLATNAGFGKEFAAVSKLLSADTIALGGSIATTAAAFVASYKALDGTIERFSRLKQTAEASGQSLGPELEIKLQALRETLGPVKAVVDTVGEALSTVWKTVKDPIGELTGANELEAALKRQTELLENIRQKRSELADSRQSEIAGYYDGELSALREQEAALRRIQSLRSEIGNIELQRSNNQIEIARQTGGNVELAQANALATELRVGLRQLGDKLQSAQKEQEISLRELDEAQVKYQAAIRDGMDKVDPKQFKALSEALDNAQKKYAMADEAVAEQKQIFEAQGALLLENVEIKLGELDAATKGTVNDEADKVRTSIYETIKEKFSALGSATGEVAQVLDNERSATVDAIKALAPKAADTAKVSGAVNEVKSGIEEQGNTIITALAKVSAVSRSVIEKLNAQQAQINQLYARLR